MGKFEHGFGTQLGAVLLLQRARSGGLMLQLGATKQQLQETDQKKIFFLRVQKGR